MKIVIKNDVFDIASRLKEIDKDYFVVWDTVKQRFEVHNSKNRGDTFCVSVPHKSLDARTITRVLYTRIERVEQLLDELKKQEKKA